MVCSSSQEGPPLKPPRVFVEQPCTPSTHLRLDGEDAHHLRDVLRVRAGDPLVVVYDGVAWDACIADITRDATTVTVLKQSSEPSSELPVEIVVLQALPKGSKMDTVVEKVVELGATRIVPIRSARSYGDASARKLQRWRRIARAAAQQAQRTIVPAVDETKDFKTAIAQYAVTAHVLVASEQARHGSLEAALEQQTSKAIALVIGPEGSFTGEELQLAVDAGCDLASLGPTILRTETAAAAMIAAIAALRQWW